MKNPSSNWKRHVTHKDCLGPCCRKTLSRRSMSYLNRFKDSRQIIGSSRLSDALFGTEAWHFVLYSKIELLVQRSRSSKTEQGQLSGKVFWFNICQRILWELRSCQMRAGQLPDPYVLHSRVVFSHFSLLHLLPVQSSAGIEENLRSPSLRPGQH